MNLVLADPNRPVAVAPVMESQRLKLIDALRGVALLGILMMNIPVFAMPEYSSEAYKGDPTNISFWVDAIITIFFEGKMRALFGMLFGAGVLLFVAKREQTGKPVTFLFYRRMMWLILFGLIHAHLILWIGDILYLYGICGMIVFLFRNVKPIYLVMGVPLVAVVDFSAGTVFYQYIRTQRIAYLDARQAESANEMLTEKQQEALTNWRKLETTLLPNREDVKENTQKMRSDYSTVAEKLRPLAFMMQTQFIWIIMWDSLALMLLGLALYRWGFLTGSWSSATYWQIALLGYALGLPLVTFAYYHQFAAGTTLESRLERMVQVPIEWTGLIYPFQRILLVMAHVSILILAYKAQMAQRLFRCLEAVGQMAFTNYIMHSVICTLFFFGYGLNYYGEFEYYQLYYVVAAIWALQLVVSPLWLKAFHFGPLEWVWRCLTYWRWQPLLRN